jgi:dihydrofolate reductase
VSKIVLMMGFSLDGFLEGPDRDIDWHFVDEEVHERFNRQLSSAGAFIEGRLTHQLMEDFWPTADEDPSAPPQIREFAGIWRDMDKYVVSTTLEEAGWGTTVLSEVVPDEIRAIAARADGDVIVGGAVLGRTFMDLGLVDEYFITVHPILLGTGHRLFEPRDRRTPLRLLEHHAFGNGVVLLRYEPA